MKKKIAHLQNKLLRFLASRDNGQYVGIEPFVKRHRINSDTVSQICESFYDFVEQESVYNHRGLLVIGESEKNQLLDDYVPKLRLTQKGRDRYTAYKKSRVNVSISKRALWISFGILIIAILTLYFTLVNPFVFFRERITAENFPSLTIRINNESSETRKAFSRQQFVLWYPTTMTGDAPNTIGIYEYNIESTKGYLTIPPGETDFTAEIVNKEKFFPLLSNRENDLFLMLRTGDGKLHISHTFPFDIEWINKYLVSIKIE